jgi:hypothetical protein
MSDDAQEARHLFEVVSLLCLLVFGIPMALLSLRMADGLLSTHIAAVGYKDLHLMKDVIYASILAVLATIPILGSYIWYRKFT